ncbi:hypothetical protein HJG60_008166 [Phyllostomus discolor]|uniref:Uncharacterized protein n=1 Tax=Phyllostomus discolor TaxID=89673 RepID=A0A833ZAV9_9CHIR|nr:hypothetical protein HJG60_008166 [Phyllostomus discolor]
MGRLKLEGPLDARPRLSPGARGTAHARCGARPLLALAWPRPGHSGRPVVDSGPAAPHRSHLSVRESPTIAPRLRCMVGLHTSPPSQNGEVARLRVLGESVAQSGFEPGPIPGTSPGVLRGVQRLAVEPSAVRDRRCLPAP